MIKLFYGMSNGMFNKDTWDLFMEFDNLQEFNKFMKRTHKMNFKTIIENNKDSINLTKYLINIELSNTLIRIK